MATCSKCQRWTSRPAFGGWCRRCIDSSGMRREAVEASLSTLPSNSFDTHLTSRQHTSPKKKTSSRSSRPQPATFSSSRSAPKSHEYFQSAITAKRKKPRAAPYPKKKPIPAVPKETKYSPSPDLRFIDCGLVLYKGKKPADDPLLFNIKQTLLVKFTPEILECISLERLPRDVEQNLSLLHGKSRLTDLDALLFVVHKSTDKKPVQVDLAYQYRLKEKKTDPIEDDDSEITEFQPRKKTSAQTKLQKIPSNLENDDSEMSEVQTRKKTSARTKSQKIPSDLEDEDSEISEVQPRKKTSARTKSQKIPSNYESPDSDQSTLPTQLVAKSKNTAMLSDQELQEYPSNETEVPRSKTTGSKPPLRKKSVAHNKPDTWASSGVVCTVPACGAASLSTQIGYLGQLVPPSIAINTKGWTNAHRLIFKTQNTEPGFDIYSESKFNWLEADVMPITLQVHHDKIVGQGSMRRAFEATVRTIASDGSVKLVNYVAKIRFRDGAPNISHYASDALMYEGSALLLDEFKKILPGCQRLREVYLKKGQLMEIVRHAVVVCGEINLPSEVYFLEVALVGPYVKYSSNVNFRIKENWEGVDPDIARLMNAFMHWSYVNSNGKSLICDLQGVGPILTDPQIIDLDEG
ncbi:alphaK I1 [Puccinia graminis f. sp. tritici CRL 75-36-700-3]|uniref:AlphaK I1 n=1 Tax=Puccinia graminis f. sp. tritici (strain CRL 75-36-700-3 / race SCCL) TaxID=418459 RepID=E3LA12_PUCGT|nr:alphaK I1 [Puccinia graminis f. sp. tritici CRL 75-36-700-3]EFP93387.2 alphaK I1 [Puccinia graminis f. sp. tritici CRL 75-36-700-3]